MCSIMKKIKKNYNNKIKNIGHGKIIVLVI